MRRLIPLLTLAALASGCSLDALEATAARIVGTTPRPPIASVTVAVVPDTLSPGRTAEAIAIPRDSSGTIVSAQVPFWFSSNPRVATVSSSGHVVAMSAGVDTIRAAIGIAQGIAVVTVR